MKKGVKWGVTLTDLRKAQRFIRAGDTTAADLIITQQIEHIGSALNEQIRDKVERRRKKNLERLLAKMNRKKD